MSEYGITEHGVKIKRLDNILDEIHSNLSKNLGFNTRQNPQSVINLIVTNFADRIAELWEFGADVYHSQYPYSAEGISLDNAAQFGGVSRRTAAPSYYYILCTGIDGTLLPTGTVISSSTNPKTDLALVEQTLISRGTFNTATVKISTANLSGTFTIILDDMAYSHVSAPGETDLDILNSICSAIDDDRFTASVDTANRYINIGAISETENHVMVLTENLTTETVGTVATFATADNGDIPIPKGAITNIVRAVTGLLSVVDVGTYIAGRNRETDQEFRQSYADRIYARSSRMLESIKSAILDGVQGVTSVSAYENDTNTTDGMGRPPHSIEVVVDGGDQVEIAKKILDTKAAGISTYGSVEVSVPVEYGDRITVRFNRPIPKKVWFHIALTIGSSSVLPTTYVEIIKDIVIEQTESINAGGGLNPQEEILGSIYKSVPGIEFVDITMAVTDNDVKPSSYDQRNISVGPRERITTDSGKIEVVIDD